jgi:putative DNA primase/helicase
MVKELTGGDPIRARRMREDFWEFRPTHTLMMATNHKPAIRGGDHGIWRRLKMVPFTVTVQGKEVDKAMPEKLRAEHPGILAWCVRGCLDWQIHGLDEPESILQATREYHEEQDRIGAFLAENVLECPHGEVKASDLYACYCQWAERGNEWKMTQTMFGIEMQERGFRTRKSGCNIYIGIMLRSHCSDRELGEL